VDLVSRVRHLPPGGTSSALLDADFLRVTGETEAHLLGRALGVVTMGKAHFLRAHLLPHLPHLEGGLRDSTMLEVLQNLPALASEDKHFSAFLANVRFVPTQEVLDGVTVLQMPSALYDPRVAELAALLDPSKAFPAPPFASQEVLGALQGLGLKFAVTPSVLIESARLVESRAVEDPSGAAWRGRVLLRYLEVDTSNLLMLHPDPKKGAFMEGVLAKVGGLLGGTDEAKQWAERREHLLNALLHIAWCPVLIDSPQEGLPWLPSKARVACPRQVRLPRDTWMASSVMRILECECTATPLAEALGWAAPPPASVLAAQLMELGRLHPRVDSESACAQDLAAAVPRIYSHLDRIRGADEFEMVSQVLEGSSWVWVGSGFAPPSKVAFHGSLSLAPYLSVVPADLVCFRGLLVALGVREAFCARDYTAVLRQVAIDTLAAPLGPKHLALVLWIVGQLADMQVDPSEGSILAVDALGLMAPAGELVYNDAPWLEDSQEGGGGGYKGGAHTTLRLIHPRLPHEVAQRVGARSLRGLMLAQTADTLVLGVSTKGWAAEAFGQHEALTVRLKHIIDAYADGPGILYELLQNADDAGASEVALLLDESSYGTASLMGPGMAAWQGPALLAFNDAVFSPQDLHNISRIGQDSKVERASTIGRFGLGFNAVYHFTDVPAFVSGDHLVYFDPHAAYLPGATPSHPGLKIKFADANLSMQFPDQFKPFLQFG
jgi:sacsin